MIVQIYEIQTATEAEVMIELGVDHVGSVVLSTEHCADTGLKETVQLVQTAGRKSSLIPLFGQLDLISQALEFYRPDILHLCENLPATPEGQAEIDRILSLQRSLKERFPEVAIMRSIPIGRKGQGDVVPSLEYGKRFEPWSDWFLTDTLISNNHVVTEEQQPVKGYVGITGQTCDWEVAAMLVRHSTIPVILAGGIGPENVASGISHVLPAGVDSCTLTNAVDGHGQARRFQKDPAKVRTMIKNARRAFDEI